MFLFFAVFLEQQQQIWQWTQTCIINFWTLRLFTWPLFRDTLLWICDYFFVSVSLWLSFFSKPVCHFVFPQAWCFNCSVLQWRFKLCSIRSKHCISTLVSSLPSRSVRVKGPSNSAEAYDVEESLRFPSAFYKARSLEGAAVDSPSSSQYVFRWQVSGIF